MKKLFLVIFCIFAFFQNLSAVDYSLGDETIALIARLPDTDDYAIDGKFVDIGIIYKSFAIASLPIINYDKRWCLFYGDTYYLANKQELDEIAGELNITLPDGLELPFWDAWGGKLILLSILIVSFLIGGFIYFYKKHRDENFIKCVKCKRTIYLKRFVNNAKIKCSKCGAVYDFPPILRIKNYKLPLFAGKQFYPKHIINGNDNDKPVLVKVLLNEQNNALQMQNLTCFAWSALCKDGSKILVEPNDVIDVKNLVSIDFNGLVGTIQKTIEEYKNVL